MAASFDPLPVDKRAVADPPMGVLTVEEADAARRHAAEIGDYQLAESWLKYERRLSAQEDRVVAPDVQARREDLRRLPKSDLNLLEGDAALLRKHLDWPVEELG
jgi:hypothetical protein